MHVRDRSHFCLFRWLNKFISACEKIEFDPNYRPDISNEQLLKLVVDGEGNSRHTPRKEALAIQRFNFPINANIDSGGMVYQVKIAKKGPIDDDSDIPVWHINDSVLILVNKKGNYSFHDKKNVLAVKPSFDSPLGHLNIHNFLGRECLHYQTEEQEMKIYNFV